jgi:RHS repeat-associated protein
MSYDAANRLTSKTYSNGDVIAYGYDAANQLTSAIWRTSGGVTNSSLWFAYDGAGRLTNETQKIGSANSRTIQYTYFDDGRRATLSSPAPNSLVLHYQYNKNGWLTNITDGTSSIVKYTYDGAGRRTQRSLPGNGNTTDYYYDNADQLTNVWHKNGGTTLAQYQYGYTNNGNRVWVKRSYPNVVGDVYRYDAADQVTNVLYDATFPDTTPQMVSNEVQYVIDSTGNWTNRYRISGGTTNGTGYLINNLNQYTQVGTTNFSYDTNGNLTSDGVWTYTYDCENRLTQATSGGNTITYTYDALGRMILRSKNGTATRYYYAGWQLIDEQDSGGNLVARYVYGAGLDEVVRMWRNSTYYRYLYDGLGNVSEITGDAGGRWESYLYDVYGNPRIIRNNNGNIISASAIGNRMMFNGRDRDPDTGLYNYRYRYYSPNLGRFVQVDPVGIRGKDVNLYRFVNNYVLLFGDGFGLDRALAGYPNSGSVGLLQAIFPATTAGMSKNPIGGSATGQAKYASEFYHPALVIAAATAQIEGVLLNVMTPESPDCPVTIVRLGRGLGKKAAKDLIQKLGLSEAQEAAALSAISRATTTTGIDISTTSGELTVSLSRPGANGFQTIKSTISVNGSKTVVQEAYDAAGNLVHLHPK